VIVAFCAQSRRHLLLFDSGEGSGWYDLEDLSAHIAHAHHLRDGGPAAREGRRLSFTGLAADITRKSRSPCAEELGEALRRAFTVIESQAFVARHARAA
jgi:hypothetical protein